MKIILQMIFLKPFLSGFYKELDLTFLRDIIFMGKSNRVASFVSVAQRGGHNFVGESLKELKADRPHLHDYMEYQGCMSNSSGVRALMVIIKSHVQCLSV